MEKFCIFCGNKPVSKNKEHVIPQWLIRMTGEQNRETYLGLKWASSKFEQRKFSFSSFTFPSCEKCNSIFSDLEAKAEIVVQKILTCQALAASDWDIFLDWLDKVRTGLWLAMIYLNKNHRGIKPNFYIKKRIGSKDRFIIIYEIQDDKYTGIGWAGTDTPIFQCMPSCFMLGINNFLFFNASFDFLFSYRFGFPFPSVWKLSPEGRVLCKLEEGTKKRLLPLVKKKFKSGGTQLFQPMIPYKHLRQEDGSIADFSELYDNDYVKKNCINNTEGHGQIFRKHRNKLVPYPSIPTKDWIPLLKFPLGELIYKMGLLVGEFLEELYKNSLTLEDITMEQKQTKEAQVEKELRAHKKIMLHFKSQKDMYY